MKIKEEPEGSHHLVVGEVLVVVFVDEVAAGLGVGPSGVLVAVEAKLQVFGKRHGPGVVGQRHHRGHLQTEEGQTYEGTDLFNNINKRHQHFTDLTLLIETQQLKLRPHKSKSLVENIFVADSWAVYR